MTHSELVPALLAFLTAADHPPASSTSSLTASCSSSNPDIDGGFEDSSFAISGGGDHFRFDNVKVDKKSGGERENKRLRGASTATSSGGGKMMTNVLTSNNNEIKFSPDAIVLGNHESPRLPPRLTRMRIFAHVFLGCSVSFC